MIEKYLLAGNEIKIELDDEVIRTKALGYNEDFDLLLTMEIIKQDVAPCYVYEELYCGIEKINDKIMRSNKFRIFVDGEEI